MGRPSCVAFVAFLQCTAPAGPACKSFSHPRVTSSCRCNAGCWPGLRCRAAFTETTCACCSFSHFTSLLLTSSSPTSAVTLTAQHLLQCTLAPLAPAGLCLLAEGEQVWLQSPLKQQLAILMASSLLASLQHCSQSASYHLSLLSPCQGCPSTRVPAARGLEAAAHVRPLTSSSLRVSGRQEISFLRNLMALPMLAERGRHWFRKLQRRNGLSSRATRGQGQE